MSRPHKNRRVSCPPGAVFYKPAGVSVRELKTVTLTLDEYEAVNLLDYQNLGQEEAASLMEVSRPTVTRIYALARQKIAQALTEGLGIMIEGGPVNERPCCNISGVMTGHCHKMRNGHCRRRGNNVETESRSENTVSQDIKEGVI